MARFTIRVELHNATRADYATLEANLAAKNITDVIVSGDGKRYVLPPAEYQCFGDLSAEQVRDIVAAATTSIGRRFAVLVTQGDSRAWQGLDLV